MATKTAKTLKSRKRQVSSTSEEPAIVANPDRCTQYARDVDTGKIVAGPYVRAACRRHLRDLENGHERGINWDLDKAQRAMRFFEEVLCLNGGDFEGQPFHLEPFEAFIVGSLFGWMGPDGHRRFRVAFIEIGKGNGKSPLAAGIGLYCLTADGEDRPEVYAGASKRDQALILFRDAVAMVDQSPELRKRVRKFGGSQTWNLMYPKRNGFFRVVSSDSGQSGYRVHCALLDEIHEHPNAMVVNMMRAGTKGRRQALIIEITNSGVDRTSICYDHHKYSADVVEGRIDAAQADSWFAYVCALDKDDEPFTDESCWIKANPNLGVSVTVKYIREQVAEARGMPSKASTVRRLNFCQWVDAYAPWIDSQKWAACEKPQIDFDSLRGLRCAFAIDLSQTTDLTAVAVAFDVPMAEDALADAVKAVAEALPSDQEEWTEEQKRKAKVRAMLRGRRVAAYVTFFTPGETLRERAEKDRVPYDVWVDQGHMIATLGSSVDYRDVALHLLQERVRFAPVAVVADPYRLSYLKKEIDNEAGVGVVQVLPHPQGGTLSKVTIPPEGGPDAKESALWMPHSVELLEALVLEGRLDVLWNPCLAWNAASAVLEQINKQGARIFNKMKSTGRIDGLVALTMAVGSLLTLESPPPRDSVYNRIARRRKEALASAQAAQAIGLAPDEVG